MPFTLTVNGRSRTVDVPADMPLLWVLRDVLDLKGTKYGCGVSQCGACTVHVNGQPTRSCSVPASSVAGRRITTIEGLSTDGTHPCSARGRRSTYRSAGTARRGRSCRLRHSSRRRRRRPTPTSTPPWAATSAAAAPTFGFVRRFTRRRPRDAAGRRLVKQGTGVNAPWPAQPPKRSIADRSFA